MAEGLNRRADVMRERTPCGGGEFGHICIVKVHLCGRACVHQVDLDVQLVRASRSHRVDRDEQKK